MCYLWYILEHTRYNSIKDKLWSLFEKAILGRLKSFFQLDHQVDTSFYLAEATALRHSRVVAGSTPTWCTSSPIYVSTYKPNNVGERTSLFSTNVIHHFTMCVAIYSKLLRRLVYMAFTSCYKWGGTPNRRRHPQNSSHAGLCQIHFQQNQQNKKKIETSTYKYFLFDQRT